MKAAVVLALVFTGIPASVMTIPIAKGNVWVYSYSITSESFFDSLSIPTDPAGRSKMLRLDKVGARRRKGKINRVPDGLLFFSHGFPRYVNFIGIVKKAITDGICDRRITKNFIPLFKSELAGYYC